MAEQGYIWRLAGVKQEPQILIKDFVLSPEAKKSITISPWRAGGQTTRDQIQPIDPLLYLHCVFKSVD